MEIEMYLLQLPFRIKFYKRRSTYRRQVVNPFWPSDALWRHIWVRISSDKGFVPGGTVPLLEPILTYRQSWSLVIIWKQFNKKCLWLNPRHKFGYCTFKITTTSHRIQWANTRQWTRTASCQVWYTCVGDLNWECKLIQRRQSKTDQ